ncbi:MAG: CBS domain-containing protein [Pseudomonadota bacterium]
MTTKIHNIMSSKVVTVEFDDSLETVKHIFDTLKFHHLLVVEDKKLYGVVSDRDLLKALSPNIGTMGETLKDLATLNKRVHQIMSRHPIILYADNTLSDAIKIFNTHNISCIPIVNIQFIPIGILSWRDVLKVFEHRLDL